MDRETRRGQRLLALFGLGCVLFSAPALVLFGQAGTLAGIPAAVIYIFLAWAAVIGLALVIIER